MMLQPLRSSRRLTLAMLACLVFCAALALDLVPALRGDFGWRWPYEAPDWPRLALAALAVAVYLVGAARIQRRAFVLAWSFAGAVLLPLACLYTLGDPLYLLATRTLSGLATGPHLAGTEIVDLGAALRNWPQIMPTYLEPGQHIMLSVHVALAPPGLPTFYYLLTRLFEGLPTLAAPLGMALRAYQCQNLGIVTYSNAQLAGAWFGILMPLWAGLAVLPMYRAGGRLAALWWPLVPSLALFAPTWNTLYPLLALLAYLLLAEGIAPKVSGPRLALAGVLLSLGTFANISIVPFGGFLGLYALVRVLQMAPVPRQAAFQLLRIGLWFGAGLVSVWVVYFLVSGVTPITILGAALGQHLELDRPYLPWVFLHLYDLALFTGLPMILIALAGPACSFGALRRRDWKAVDPLAVSLALTLILLTLSGTARGETGRVWLFFGAFLIVVAARQFAPTQGERPPAARDAALASLAQAVTWLTLVGFLRVMGTELTPPPTVPPDQPAPGQAQLTPLPAPAEFAGSFALVGWGGAPDQKGILLTLAWEATRPADAPYYFSALVVRPDGQPLPQAVNWQPFETSYPVTCWRPGQRIVETRHLPLAQDSPSGAYWISLSAFERHSGQVAITPVNIARPGAAQETQIGLGPIERR